jgi:hypothetical protein
VIFFVIFIEEKDANLKTLHEVRKQIRVDSIGAVDLMIDKQIAINESVIFRSDPHRIFSLYYKKIEKT